MQKKISLAIIALLFLGFAAERRLNSYSPRRNGVTTVRVVISAWQYSEFMTPDKDLERALRAFERRHPEIKIDLRIMPETDGITLMLPWRANTTPFDLLMITSNQSIGPYVEGGFIQPLDEILKPELDAGLLKEFLPGYLQYCKGTDPRIGKEKLYGLPWLGEIMALNYRKDMLAECGLSEKDVPQTYEQMEALARKFRDPNKNQYGLTLDLSTGFFTQNAYVPLLRSYRGSIVDAKGHLDVSSPEAIKTFETLKRWYQEGLMLKGALTPYQSADDFRAKIAVCFPNWQSRGFWAMRMMKDGQKCIGIGPVPGSKKNGALLAHYIGIIPKASPVPKEAARVLLEAFCFDLQTGVGKAGKMMVINYPYDRQQGTVSPAPPALQPLRDLVPPYRVPDWMLALRPTVDKGYCIPDPLTWSRVSDIVGIEYQKYINEDISAKDALARAKRQMDALYK